MLRPHHRRGLTVVEMLAILVILVILGALMLPPMETGHRFIGHRTFKSLLRISRAVCGSIQTKSLVTTPGNGFSWRVAVAAELNHLGTGERAVGPVQLASQFDWFRECGPVRESGPDVCMVIRGVAAEDAFWSREDLGVAIPDGERNTIMLVAIRDDGHAWYEPFDPTPDELYREPYFGDPDACKGLRVAFADGSYKWLPPTLAKAELLELISTDGDPIESAQIVDSLSKPH